MSRKRIALGPTVNVGKPQSEEALMDVISEIQAERHRQRWDEGWTQEHDDAHDKGEMAAAAACYALNAVPERFADGVVPIFWPWSREWWKPKSRRRDLVRAAALIVAEIERMDRASVAKMAEKLEASGAVIDQDLHGRLR